MHSVQKRGNTKQKNLQAKYFFTRCNLKSSHKMKFSIKEFLREIVVRNCSCKKGVLNNFAKFTGKQLCQNLFFNKVAGLTRNFKNTFLKKTLEKSLPKYLLFPALVSVKINEKAIY